MRTIHRMMAIAACFASIGMLPAQTAQPEKPATPSSWIQRLDIDQLDPIEQDNLVKITLMLHSEDVPRAQRLDYARRYLRGEYKYNRRYNHRYEEAYTILMHHAIWELGRLNDIDSISLLEEKRAQWEEEQKKPDEQRTMAGFNPIVAEAVIARLKAVRDVPQVRNAGDLIRRLERMLHHIGFDGSIDAWLRELETRLEKGQEAGSHLLYRGVHYWVLMQYGQLILEAGWNGVNVEPASKVIRLRRAKDITEVKSIAEVFEVYVQLARVGRDKAAQWIVNDAINWHVLRSREEACAEALSYMGSSVAPLVWSKLEWATRHRDQIKGSGMGLVALMQVLVNVGGEQALSLIAPFLNDENEWVRYYACQAKEYIQQGKLFILGAPF